MKPKFKQEGLVQFVINSVYALAHAIQDMLNVRCPGWRGLCLRYHELAGPELLNYIRNVSFTGTKGQNNQIKVVGQMTICITERCELIGLFIYPRYSIF